MISALNVFQRFWYVVFSHHYLVRNSVILAVFVHSSRSEQLKKKFHIEVFFCLLFDTSYLLALLHYDQFCNISTWWNSISVAV